MGEKICFPKNTFLQTVGLVITIIIIAFVIFTYYLMLKEPKVQLKQNGSGELLNQIKQLKNTNYELGVSNERCNQNVFMLENQRRQTVGREGGGYTRGGEYGGTYGATRQYVSPDQPGSDINYRQVGFLYDANNRYSLYGRYLYKGRTDLWEYYIVDDSRNKIRIPFKSPNNKEIFDGDTVTVPTIGTLSATIYEVEQYKYPSF